MHLSPTPGVLVPEIRNRYPRLNTRAAGWLRHLHRKATTRDDWSEDGVPHDWWDRTSTAPMLSFPRFDLSESSYGLGVMADQTPAWREVYAEILRLLAERHLTYWASVDWITHIGHDPRRGAYPKEWIDAFIPPHLVGRYDAPGWLANGVEPWGLQPDPVGADGNLYFKGWLNLVQSLHAYVTGEDKWGDPFKVAGIDRTRFEWTQHRVVELLVKQFNENPLGPHCENTKIWPYCLTAAGLGLQLYDRVFGKSSHHVYEAWLEGNKDRHFVIDPKTGALKTTTLYYDPEIDYVQPMGPGGGLSVSFYLIPQVPAFAEFLYRSVATRLGWNDPSKPIPVMPDPRLLALGLVVAKEFGDYVTEARLRDYAEANFEPRFFGEGEFGFWFNLGEAWPRGQYSALAMLSEVGEPGAWSRLFREPNLAKLHQPTVSGVDFPKLGIAQAWNDTSSGLLQIVTYAGDASHTDRPTTFRVSQLPDPASVMIICDGTPFSAWRTDGGDAIMVETTCASHSFQIFTSHHGQESPVSEQVSNGGELAPDSNQGAGRAAEGGPQAVGGTDLHQLLKPASCQCCPP